MAKNVYPSRIQKTIETVQNWVSKMLPYSVAILTFITGVAFGFGPMNTFLSVASEYTGIISSIMQCLVIIPSCFFQTILWWNAYYQPAKEQLSPKTDKEKQEEAIRKEIENITQWNDCHDTRNLHNGLKRYIQNKAEALAYVQKEVGRLEILGQLEEGRDDNTQYTDSDIINQKVVLILSKHHQIGLYEPNPESKQKPSIRQQRLNFIKQWLPKIANALNYATINPFGVFFAFYTALLTITFPGVSLAAIILPASMMPAVISILGIGYAAGFVCAFYLTSGSFTKTVNSAVDYLAKYMSTDEVEVRIWKVERRLDAEFAKVKAKKSEHLWAWLTNRPRLGMVLAFGCGLSVSIFNYYSGIQTAMMICNIAILLTPNQITSAKNLLGATIVQKLFGVYSALITVFMTSALLFNVAIDAKPQKKAEQTRAGTTAQIFFWSAVIFSTLGQLFSNYINVVKPHGILSALRLIKAPCERLFQAIFGIFSLGGTVIISKLQAESAESIIGQVRKWQETSTKNTKDRTPKKPGWRKSIEGFFLRQPNQQNKYGKAA